MKKIIHQIKKWFGEREADQKEVRLRALHAESVRIVNIHELSVSGETKYGVFLDGNLIDVYDTPSQALLDRLLALRKMYVEFWGPYEKYQVK